MVSTVIRKALAALAKKPVRLWGISLMYVLLVCIAGTSFAVVPIVGTALTLTLGAGMAALYLGGIHGKEVHSDQLFDGFRNFWHVTGGMCWMALWLLIWGLVPVMGIVKAYAYRFTPYILMTQPEVPATQALKLSEQQTKGYKGKMFGADVLIYVLLTLCSLLLVALAQIPVLGVLFWLAFAVFVLLVLAFYTLYKGLVKAYFYNEIVLDPKPEYASSADADYYCPYCGAPVRAGAAFCASCGKPLAPIGSEAPAAEATAEPTTEAPAAEASAAPEETKPSEEPKDPEEPKE